MFRPFRLIFMVVLAFMAGVMFEREDASERCDAAGGDMIDRLCQVAS